MRYAIYRQYQDGAPVVYGARPPSGPYGRPARVAGRWYPALYNVRRAARLTARLNAMALARHGNQSWFWGFAPIG